MVDLVEELKQFIVQEKRNGTVFYQTHTWNDIELNTGIRDISRRKLVKMGDVKGKVIADLGCATAAESIWAMENGAKATWSVDQPIADAPQMKTVFNFIQKLKDLKIDFANNMTGVPYNLFNGVPTQVVNAPIDTAFCFAITQHINYRKIWKEIPSVKVVYIEGGADSPYTVNSLTDANFKATLIGRTTGNRKDARLRRPLFRLVRK